MHKGLPAIIESKYGNGRVLVLGTDPGKVAMEKILLYSAQVAGVQPLAIADPEVVIVPRVGKDAKGYVLVNISNKPRQITMPDKGSFIDMLTDRKHTVQSFVLKPYEVMVLQEQMN